STQASAIRATDTPDPSSRCASAMDCITSIMTEQPDTKCDPPTITWLSAPNRLTCKRVDDAGALCKDGVNFEHEFRRKAKE
ncbi:MAG: hypothetical protein NTV97_23365, partial [Alphaproteobacteria bacterium]|nr:hypothetical protein [Alphaproteobacteria bacterium]